MTIAICFRAFEVRKCSCLANPVFHSLKVSLKYLEFIHIVLAAHGAEQVVVVGAPPGQPCAVLRRGDGHLDRDVVGDAEAIHVRVRGGQFTEHKHGYGDSESEHGPETALDFASREVESFEDTVHHGEDGAVVRAVDERTTYEIMCEECG